MRRMHEDGDGPAAVMSELAREEVTLEIGTPAIGEIKYVLRVS